MLPSPTWPRTQHFCDEADNYPLTVDASAAAMASSPAPGPERRTKRAVLGAEVGVDSMVSVSDVS